MKRILLSGAIAIGLHAVFLISLPMLSQKNYKPAIPETKSVIVTMSYQTLKPKKEKQKVKPVKKFVKKKSVPKQKPEIKPLHKLILTL